jgi:transposase-like protein
MKQGISLPRLAQSIDSEADAYAFLESLRWADGVVCPHCGATGRCFFLKPANDVSRKTRTGAVSQRRVWKCGDCRRQFSVLTGTIFHGTKIPVRTWLMVIFEMCSAKNGISAREIERKYELTAKSAWFMCHRIREAMRREPLAGLLRGTIVADETWIGGDPKNRHGGMRYGKGKGPNPTDKQPVLALVHKETGEVRSHMVPTVRGPHLRQVIEAHVDMANSDLQTDSSKSYLGIGPDFARHDSVNHFKGEYVRAAISTNSAEGYFSQLKRSLDGTHHAVSVEHLPRYLAQFDFLRSNCKDTDTQRMLKVVDNAAGRRLTYKPLTSNT